MIEKGSKVVCTEGLGEYGVEPGTEFEVVDVQNEGSLVSVIVDGEVVTKRGDFFAPIDGENVATIAEAVPPEPEPGPEPEPEPEPEAEPEDEEEEGQ